MSNFRICFTTHSTTGEPERLWAYGLHGEPIPSREILGEALAAEALAPGGAFRVIHGREPTPAEALPPVARAQVQPTRQALPRLAPQPKPKSTGTLTAGETAALLGLLKL